MFFLATVLASAGYYFGYYISIFNPVATPLLRNVLHLSDDTTPSIKDVQGNIFSFTAIMAFATLFFVPTINKKLGRLRAIFLGEILGIVSMAPFLFLDKFESDLIKVRWLEASRLLTGIVMALNTSSGQLLLKELFFDGWLEIGTFITFVVIGGMVFLSFAIGLFQTEQQITSNWRFILGGPAFISIIRFSCLLIAWKHNSRGKGKPGIESPKWIMETYWNQHLDTKGEDNLEKNRKVRARTVKEIRRLLENLYHPENIDLKISEIIADFESQNSRAKVSFAQMVCGDHAKSVYLAILINVGMKLTGHDFIMFFSTDLFNKISGE